MEISIPRDGNYRPIEKGVQLPDSVEKLVSELNFVETPEMVEIRKSLVGLNSEEYIEPYLKYRDLAQLQVDLMPGPEGRLALMLRGAQIKETVGDVEGALEDYYDSEEVAGTYSMQAQLLAIEILRRRLQVLAAQWPADIPKH